MLDSVWKVTTGPTSEPVTISEAKAHSYITTTDEDDLVARMITSAREEFERLTAMACLTQTVTESFEKWPTTGYLTLSRWPLSSVTSITYVDENGTSYTLSSSYYWVDTTSEPGRVWLHRSYWWPTVTLRPGPSITATYVAGYSSTTLPTEIKSLVLMAFGDLYENRESTITGAGLTVQTMQYVRNALLNYRRRAF